MRAGAVLCLSLVLAGGPSHAGVARCWYENGALVAPAAFGDIAGDFIVDVSAPTSQLHLTRAQGDGIEAAVAKGSLTLAGERLDGVAIAVADLDARSAGFPTVINGVIGADVLQRFVVEIAFAPCRLILYRRAPARWRNAVRLAVRRVGAIPVVAAGVSDGVTARRGAFAIDTASAGLRLAQASLSRQPPAGVDPASRTRPAARLRALSLAGRLIENAPAGLIDGAPAGLDGAIGDAVWSRFAMRLDLKGGWLDLAPAR
jgi:hypothetical protein